MHPIRAPPLLAFAASLLSSASVAPVRSIASSAMRRPPRLITFDIDGTLLKSLGPQGNRAHHDAVNSAVRATYGITTKVEDVPHAGSTDMAIMRRMCTVSGVPAATIDARLPAALADAASRIAQLVPDSTDYTHLVLPGVIPALDALKERGCAVALATGNIEKIAWTKLSAAGISHYFSTGGFGSDAENRQDIVKKAIGSIDTIGRFAVEDVVHVGDAVADVAVSREIGVDAIGVLTGVFTRQQLEAENPLAVFDDLSDTGAFLRVLGFAEQP